MDVDDDTPPDTPPPEEKPKRRRRQTSAAKKPTSRFERRAEKAKTTLRELIKLRRPDLDVSGLTFLEVVDRDADAWGKAVAQVAEWLIPFGQLVDLIFGQPLLVMLSLAPSVRAARRDLVVRRERRKQQRLLAEQERLDEEARLQEQQSAE